MSSQQPPEDGQESSAIAKQELDIGEMVLAASSSYKEFDGKSYKLSQYGEAARKEGALALKCFCVAGAIPQISGSFEFTGILLDSGASSNVVTRQLADAAGLQLIPCEPVAFEMADGSFRFSDHKVNFTLYLAGVGAQITAYVEESIGSRNMILGMAGWQAFLLQPNFSYGRRQDEMRVTVARDKTGYRRTRLLVPRDDRLPSWSHRDRRDDPIPMLRGETAKERKQREMRERRESRQ